MYAYMYIYIYKFICICKYHHISILRKSAWRVWTHCSSGSPGCDTAGATRLRLNVAPGAFQNEGDLSGHFETHFGTTHTARAKGCCVVNPCLSVGEQPKATPTQHFIYDSEDAFLRKTLQRLRTQTNISHPRVWPFRANFLCQKQISKLHGVLTNDLDASQNEQSQTNSSGWFTVGFPSSMIKLLYPVW